MYVCIFVVKIVFENVNSIKYSVNVLPVHTAMTVVYFFCRNSHRVTSIIVKESDGGEQKRS